MWFGSSTETSEASVTGSDRVQAETERIPANIGKNRILESFMNKGSLSLWLNSNGLLILTLLYWQLQINTRVYILSFELYNKNKSRMM